MALPCPEQANGNGQGSEAAPGRAELRTELLSC